VAPEAAPGGGRPPSGVDAEEMPRIQFSRRGVLLLALFVGSCLAFLYLVLPKIIGLKDTWHRIAHGNAWWLALGALLEVCSFVSYVFLFRGVFVRERSRIDLRVSYEITLAGLAATRLFASAGAGGVALTAWALRRSGMDPRTVAERMISFMTLIYVVFLGSLIIGGFGLYLGVLPGPQPIGVTLAPALFATFLVVLCLSVAFVPADFQRLAGRFTGEGRLGRLGRQLATAPATVGGGIRLGLQLPRTRDPQLLGALGWWGCDMAVLWACFHAFGGAPTVPVVVVCYFIGQLGNLLPLPGGIGGVDGALIGSFTAFGVPGSLAVVAVLAYRAFAFWLPTLPGVVAYVQLRRSVRRWDGPQPATA
jgi:uncharacterized membrane protein YbhN (UPF0104 family)